VFHTEAEIGKPKKHGFLGVPPRTLPKPCIFVAGLCSACREEAAGRLRDATVFRARAARQPMGRLGTPEEIADLAVYLAGATYTSGDRWGMDNLTARMSVDEAYSIWKD
jgi:hypothetical protein